MNWYDIRVKGKGTIIVKANSSNQAISEAEDRMGVEFSNNDEVTCRNIGEYDPYKKYPETEKNPKRLAERLR